MKTVKIKLHRFASSFIFGMWLIIFLPLLVSGNETRIEMALQFEPDLSELTGNVKIVNPSDSIFSLAKGLKVISIKSNGVDIPFTENMQNSNSLSSEYRINSIPNILVINFSGRINQENFPKTTSNINMITSGLIELSDYIDWYPKIKKGSPAIYRLTVDLPGNFESITNCNKVKETKKGNRILTEWVSDSKISNITLLASPGLKKSVLTDSGNTIEIFYNQLPVSYIDSMKRDLMKTWNFYKSLYVTEGAEKSIRIIYSPRSAGGYARAPLIIVSEKYALEQLSSDTGYARDFRLNAHEIAHYWSKAHTATVDDWINEGLAEFSALLASELFIGKDFSDLLIEEYNGIVNNTQTDVSVIETKNESWEREINRYYKPTLLLNDLRIKYGNEMQKNFFHTLYKKIEEEKTATTQVFLDALKSIYGNEEKESFLERLSDKNWAKEVKKSGTVNLDTAIIGTWEGKLTQFGTTTEFIMNIKLSDGEVIATLDSPDQNAFDIPVSEFQFVNDTIFYRLGIASATFTGVVDKENNIINGIWSQRNTEYPLNLSKQKNQ